MIKFITYDKSTGEIKISGHAGEFVAASYETEDTGVLLTDKVIATDAAYVDLESLTVIEIDKKPSPAYMFDPETKDWIPDGEKLANQIRLERDERLKETDWSQAQDIPDGIKSAFTAYRQALRDITDQEGFPYNVSWPAKPE